MATNTLQSLHHRSLLKRHPSDTAPSQFPSSLLFKSTSRTPSATLSHSLSSITFSFSSTTSTSPSTSQTTVSYDVLQQHLSSKNYRLADEETRRLLIVLAGEAAQKRGYVFFSEVQFISEADLKTIDELWRQHSNNKFGYSVQKRLWEKANKDFTRFFLKVGWMKKLDTEVEQWNYRSFPTEFMWELTDETPEGHLPLTNALRGIQLLNSILSHPAFDSMQDEEKEDIVAEEKGSGSKVGLRDGSKPLSKRVFKSDYSF
ncbi:GUN4-like [Dillenia turbinata]|uniref:GUN4-like n=1 Tax=Dillenia turbinata TaxID=194707 RepID=A0AAN8YVJ9_9MAGN